MNPSTRRRRSFSTRLLVELIRIREEAAGHPEESGEADFAAIQAGGDLLDRIDARARELPSAQGFGLAIGRVIRSGTLLGAALIAMASVGGIFAAAKALEATRPANLPLALCVLVGLNFVTLLLWLILQPFSHRIVGLGGYLRSLLQWLIEHPFRQRISHWISPSDKSPVPDAGRPPGAAVSAAEVLGVIVADGRGRWLFGTVVHTLWLCFALASSISLAVLLSLRSYELSWQTTLLSTGQLSELARILSFVPAKLGLVRIESLDTSTAVARQSWSSWLVWATLIYGALPRAIALCICLTLSWRSARSIGCDLSRPGFARLRARLMTDSRELEVSDPDIGGRAESPRSSATAFVPLHGSVHGVGIDGAAKDGAPDLPGVEWTWLGQVDEPISFSETLQRLGNERVAMLAVAVRATMTPDRGVERMVAELARASRAPTVLILQDLDRLNARGTDPSRSRVSCWQALANSAGATGLLAWDGEAIHADETLQGLS